MLHRIFYIDALRVIAVILMIQMHLPQHYPLKDSLYAPLGNIFSMALFFIISGYVTNINRYKLSSRLRLLIPFFIIGMLYTFLCDKPFSSFFTTMDKNGYWFLWIIVLYNIFIYAIIKSKLNFHFGFCCFEVIMIVICTCVPDQILYLFSIKLALLYWPFIYLGFIINNEIFKRKIASRKTTQIILFLLGSVSFIFSIFGFLTDNLIINKLYAAFTIVALFVLFKQIFNDSAATNQLQYIITVIGRNSLQIYTLHYFFLNILEIKAVQSYASIINKYNLEVFLSPIAAIVIIGMCVITAKLIYRIRLGVIFGR